VLRHVTCQRRSRQFSAMPQMHQSVGAGRAFRLARDPHRSMHVRRRPVPHGHLCRVGRCGDVRPQECEAGTAAPGGLASEAYRHALCIPHAGGFDDQQVASPRRVSDWLIGPNTGGWARSHSNRASSVPRGSARASLRAHGMRCHGREIPGVQSAAVAHGHRIIAWWPAIAARMLPQVAEVVIGAWIPQ